MTIFLLDASIFSVNDEFTSGISTQFATDLHCIFLLFGMSTCSLRTVAFYIPSSTSGVGDDMMFILSHCVFSLIMLITRSFVLSPLT